MSSRKVFHDGFNQPDGSAPSPAFWSHEVGPGAVIGGNNELETYVNSRSNSFIENRILHIRATENGSGTYNSARIHSVFRQAFGTWEARLKFASTPGAWPCWWFLGTNPASYPLCGEVDAVEVYGTGGSPDTTVWTPQGNRMTHSKCTQWEGDNLWHTWRVWHDAETGNFQFYKDGRSYFTVRPSDLPNWCYGDHNPLYMILNMAVGGTGGGTPPASEFQGEMLIDWVVAYEGGN